MPQTIILKNKKGMIIEIVCLTGISRIPKKKEILVPHFNISGTLQTIPQRDIILAIVEITEKIMRIPHSLGSILNRCMPDMH